MVYKKKITGICETKTVDPDSHQPHLINCGVPARFYKDIGWFGIYMCDECYALHLKKAANNG